jgi:C4-dicarboxylate-specific signal transduction histidine kinase/CheY-like chemotaxis protein
MLRASLARRFILFISVLVLATSMSLSLFMLAREQGENDRQIRQRSVSLARNLAHNAELGVLTRNHELLLDLAQGLLREPDVDRVTVTDADGSLLMEEGSNEPNTPRLVASTNPEVHETEEARFTITPFTQQDSERTEAYEVTFPVFTRRDERQNEEIGFLLPTEQTPNRLEAIGQVRVRLSLAAMHRDLAKLRWTLGLLTSLVISVAILLTVLLVKRMVAPLQALAAATRDIAEGHLTEVKVEASEDEIGQLAESFSRMISELSRSRRELENYSASLEEQVRLRSEELEAAQSQLVQGEKMTAVGLLVSGVAHELNNPLTGVIGFSQLLLMSNTDEKIRRRLQTINREAERCKKIVHNLQTFARKHKPEKDYIGVNGILEQTLELRSYQLNVDNIKVVTDLEPQLPKTMADYYQLQRVFLNIIINAHQAMASAGDEGELILRTRSRGDTIVVQIEDDGPGIAPENLGKLFDPFFTTKEVGQGTGLGLSICYGIVEEHRGRLSVDNSATGGAIFTVELPIIQPETHETDEPEEIAVPEAKEVPRRNILVVDDETAIIEILHQLLSSEGHRVDTAVNGNVAWRKIQNEQYDLVISDLKMPGMSGQELHAKVREWNRELSKRFIFATGDILNSETHRFLDESGNCYLQKPFELDALRQAVNDALAVECR